MQTALMLPEAAKGMRLLFQGRNEDKEEDIPLAKGALLSSPWETIRMILSGRGLAYFVLTLWSLPLSSLPCWPPETWLI